MLAGASWTQPLGEGHELGARVLPPPEGAPRSRVLLLHARYRLLNRTGVELHYRLEREHGHTGNPNPNPNP